MHVVFLGNCQALALHDIFRRFLVPWRECTVDHVDGNKPGDTTASGRLRRADIVVRQIGNPVGHEISPLHGEIPAGARVFVVPQAIGAFLWPYQGTVHPAAPAPASGNPPYMPENSDKFLSKLILDRVAPEEALRLYRAHDVARAAHAGRLYELLMETQARLDADSGFNCASIIRTHLKSEQLFQSAYHFEARIARHIAATLVERMGFPAIYADRIRTFLNDGPFVARWVPIHPSIARFFELAWWRDDLRYPFLWEGSYSFDEYVIRYMQARWSEALQDGIIAARRNDPAARDLLARGLREAPGSSEGWHEMSRFAERDGDLKKAVRLQRRAVHCHASSHTLMRLATLLHSSGESRLALEAIEAAIKDDQLNWNAWALKRDILGALGKPRRALAAAEKAASLAPQPAQALEIVERLRRRVARISAA